MVAASRTTCEEVDSIIIYSCARFSCFLSCEHGALFGADFPAHIMKFKALLPVLLIVLVVLVVVLDTQRRSAQRELKNLTVRLEQLQGNTQENQERARSIVQKVQELMDIDTSVEPTVATIVDVIKLRQNNPFYNKAENGDYLIVTPTRAILYRENENKILDVVPVQIEEPAAKDDAR